MLEWKGRTLPRRLSHWWVLDRRSSLGGHHRRASARNRVGSPGDILPDRQAWGQSLWWVPRSLLRPTDKTLSPPPGKVQAPMPIPSVPGGHQRTPPPTRPASFADPFVSTSRHSCLEIRQRRHSVGHNQIVVPMGTASAVDVTTTAVQWLSADLLIDGPHGIGSKAVLATTSAERQLIPRLRTKFCSAEVISSVPEASRGARLREPGVATGA
jgi:hypothetical protein